MLTEHCPRESMMGQYQAEVIKAAELSFGRGKVGQRYPLHTPEAEAEHAQNLANHTVPLSIFNTAYCGDERKMIGLANGENDPARLRQLVVPQLLGGSGLASTKALVATNAAIVRDAKNIWDAYEITTKRLRDLGEEDAGHDNCGASMSVESSVANATASDLLIPTVRMFMPSVPNLSIIVNQNFTHKYDLLQSGFYSGWDAEKHKDYLTSTVPHNFSYLAVDPHDHETYGHNGSSIYITTSEDKGFEKNGFIEDTGQEAFSITLAKIFQLSYKLGSSDEERTRIASAYLEDTIDVASGIVKEGMPVFVESA